MREVCFLVPYPGQKIGAFVKQEAMSLLQMTGKQTTVHEFSSASFVPHALKGLAMADSFS